MISRIVTLVYELPHELRLRILGNKEILGKCQIWVQTSAQSPFQKLNFGNSIQKTLKSRYQTFLVLSSFTGFLYFVPNFLSTIVWANKILVLIRHSPLQISIFWHYINHQSIYSTFKVNIKQVSCVKLTILMVLCEQYFLHLV